MNQYEMKPIRAGAPAPIMNDGGIERVHVALGERSYDVEIGEGLLAAVGARIAPLLHRPRVAIITDETVAGLHLGALQASLDRAGISHSALALPAGEATKSWQGLARAVEWLLSERVERRDLVLAFGGGVIGDLVGFASAILRRGVRFVQIPTTLLAQVDSSVGGKTGINTAQGKNLVGAFHQPCLVLADTGLLSTLGARDFRSGYGEVVKYGLLGDARLFDWLESSGPAIAAGDLAARRHAVARSVAMKAGIVARDETEEGERALLNLGHTFGHALEAATGYSDRLLHGEAVAIGCMLALELSVRLGLCPPEAARRLRRHLREMGMPDGLDPIAAALPAPEALMALMAQDKKVVDGRLRFILVRGIGDAFIAEGVPAGEVLALLADARRA